MIYAMKTLLCLVAVVFTAVRGDEVASHIVGGVDATYGDHPYICSLQRGVLGIIWSHSCGAVIYNQRTIVTAAHCVDGTSPSSLRVICGLHHLNTNDAHQVTRNVASLTRHPQWNANGAGYPNDVAVLTLSSPLTFNSHINAITFASSGSFVGQECTLSGWGLTAGGGSTSNALQKVGMTKISNEDCASRWQTVSGADINNGHICFYNSVNSACNGDSGGPVKCGNILTGVTSWGISSCDGSYPSVYTRISHFHSWISANAAN